MLHCCSPLHSTQRENHVNKTAFIVLTVFSALVSARAHADMSANIGWVSDYYYRGIFQARSSASGGIDFSDGGFYAGAWAADVNDGLEVDGYFGYGREIGDVSLGIGFTGYYYTQDFDDTYEEVNLSAGYGFASVDVAFGEYDNFGDPTEDYVYYALTLQKDGFHGRYAGFSRDFSGNYFEFGYARSLAEIDLALILILADDDLVGESTESLVFSVGKTFDLN